MLLVFSTVQPHSIKVLAYLGIPVTTSSPFLYIFLFQIWYITPLPTFFIPLLPFSLQLTQFQIEGLFNSLKGAATLVDLTLQRLTVWTVEILIAARLQQLWRWLWLQLLLLCRLLLQLRVAANREAPSGTSGRTGQTSPVELQLWGKRCLQWRWCSCRWLLAWRQLWWCILIHEVGQMRLAWTAAASRLWAVRWRSWSLEFEQLNALVDGRSQFVLQRWSWWCWCRWLLVGLHCGAVLEHLHALVGQRIEATWTGHGRVARNAEDGER